MATRFYLPSTGAAAVSPDYDSNWTDTTTVPPTRLKCVITKISSAMTTIQMDDADATLKRFVYRQYVSDIIAAQTISAQTIKGQMRYADVSGVSSNVLTMISIRVVSGDGSTVRGTIWSDLLAGGTAAANPVSLPTLKNRIFLNTTSTEVIAQAGDRIVIEVGQGGDPDPGGDHAIALSIGDDSGTDLPEDNTETTAYNPWIEFVNTITFEVSSTSLSKSLSPSLSKSLSPSLSVSLSKSLSPSLSQSLSSSISISLSKSLSPSFSNSPSLSPSLSKSLSKSLSPSLSLSFSPSLSQSLSPSASISQSLSISLSKSLSLSLSPSLSKSLSPSASQSPSASPSLGYSFYTRGDTVALPANDNDLETTYTEQEETDVSTRNDVRIGQTGTLQYMLHQFKVFVGSQTFCSVEYEGGSTLAASSSPIYLQLFNQDSGLWETIDSETEFPADVDLELTANIANLTDYKDASNVISCRVWQLAL